MLITFIQPPEDPFSGSFGVFWQDYLIKLFVSINDATNVCLAHVSTLLPLSNI
jgi:hypothetical protein